MPWKLDSLNTHTFAENGVEFVTDALKHTYDFVGFQVIDSCRIDTLWQIASAPITGNSYRNVLIPVGQYIPFHGTAIRFMRATKVSLIKR